MRVSRAPEGRSAKKRIVLSTLVTVIIIAAVVVFYLSRGSDSLSAKDEQAIVTQETALPSPSTDDQAISLAPTPTPEPKATRVPTPTARPAPTPAPNPTPTLTPAPTPTEIPEATPQPTVAPTTEPESPSVPKVLPDAKFGEVLEEGLIELKLPAGELVSTWYSFQVDTETRDITMVFAQYDDELETILSSVTVPNYTRGFALQTAEVTLYYPDKSRRILFFDGDDGSITLSQQYRLPIGPSMFSSGLRRALVYYGMQLQNDAGDVEVELHLDLSGLSQSEGLEFKRLVPGTVDDVLLELQFLVEQIEEKRLQP